MPKTIIIDNDSFFTNSALILESDGTAQTHVRCEVGDAWYTANSASLPTHYLAEDDGSDVKLIGCSL